MNVKLFLILVAALSAVVSLPAQTGAEPSAAEAKLREALRNTMLQLRTVQGEVAAAQAKQAEVEQALAAQKTQLGEANKNYDVLRQKSIQEKETADKNIAALQAQGTQKDGQIAQLATALEKWKEGYNLAVKAVQEKDAALQKLLTENQILTRTIGERESQNIELYKLAREILERYEKFSLGEALGAKEPFTGLSKVKLENLVQDYRGKLLDQKARQVEAKNKASATPPAAAQAQAPQANKAAGFNP